MPRGCRYVIVAALGWLALSGARYPDTKGQREQDRTEETITASLSNIAATINEFAERAHSPDKQTEPCRRGDDRRYSDLCAQWKAADAASDSAWWAWASGIVGISSLAGVLIALGLAFESNRIVRKTAKLQLRAYISYDNFTLDGFESLPPKGVIRVKNDGQTPAHHVVGYGEGLVWNGVNDPPEDYFAPNRQEAEPKTVLGPNHGFGVVVDPPKFKIGMIDALRAGEAKLIVYGFVAYSDIFGEKHFTRFRLIYCPKKDLYLTTPKGNEAT